MPRSDFRGADIVTSRTDLMGNVASTQVAFVCPHCRQPLGRSEECYTCTECGTRYPIVAGISDFSPDTDIYWGELSPEEMKGAIGQAERGGYQAGADFAASCCPGLRDYLLAQYRIDWLFHCISVSNTESCLDIGSGWGTLSRSLTHFYRKVWSLEIVRERLAFQAAFKKYENLEGLELLRASAINLPFPDGSFDLVVANGIIQWIGLADPARPVEELQLQFLRECRRVLRPGGVLFLGCENRLGIFQWLGDKDHSGLPYTSLMPRRVASWVVRRFRRTKGKFVRSFRTQGDWDDYRTYTYSVKGYEQLLRGAGFGDVQSYWAHPTNNEPQYMGRMNDSRSIRELLEFASRNLDLRVEGSLLSQFLVRLRFLAGFSAPVKFALRLLAPELIFFARSVQEAPAAVKLESLVEPYSMRYGGSNKIVWLGCGTNGQKSVVKMARFPEDRGDVEREEEMLQRYNGVDVVREKHGDWILYREPFLDGKPIDCLSTHHNQDALAHLFSLHGKSASGTWSTTDFARDVQFWRDKFCDVADGDDLRAMAAHHCQKLIETASAYSMPVVVEHGDYWWRNIIRTSEGKIYLIDWQHTRPAGDPLFDFAMLSYTHWETWQKRAGKKHLAGRPADTLDWMVKLFCERLGVSPELIYAYYPYFLIRRAVRSAKRPRYDLLRLLQGSQFPTRDSAA